MTKRPQVELPSLALTFHELRAPLGFVASAATLIADEASEPVMQEQALMIMRAANRMLTSARAVLLAASSAPPPTDQFFDLHASIQHVIDDMRWTGLRMEQNSPHQGPAVSGSAEEFEALLSSLLLNAWDHGDRAHPVVVNVHEGANQVSVSVTNRCSATPRHNGLGLGTVVVSRLAERIGAAVTYQERDGWFTSLIELRPRGAALP